MKRLCLLLLAGCPSNDGGNAPTLWIAPDGGETQIKFVEDEPPPF